MTVKIEQAYIDVAGAYLHTGDESALRIDVYDDGFGPSGVAFSGLFDDKVFFSESAYNITCSGAAQAGEFANLGLG